MWRTCSMRVAVSQTQRKRDAVRWRFGSGTIWQQQQASSQLLFYSQPLFALTDPRWYQIDGPVWLKSLCRANVTAIDGWGACVRAAARTQPTLKPNGSPPSMHTHAHTYTLDPPVSVTGWQTHGLRSPSDVTSPHVTRGKKRTDWEERGRECRKREGGREREEEKADNLGFRRAEWRKTECNLCRGEAATGRVSMFSRCFPGVAFGKTQVALCHWQDEASRSRTHTPTRTTAGHITHVCVGGCAEIFCLTDLYFCLFISCFTRQFE